MLYYVTVGERTLEVELGPGGARIDGRRVDAEIRRVEGTRVHSLLADGASHRVLARRDGGGVWDLHLRGRRVSVSVVDERTRTIREMTGTGARELGPGPLRAPMPGLVVKIEVGEGDLVEAGQGLVIVEAMKMENELVAERPGRVSAVRVAPGEAVEKSQVLVEFDEPGEAGEEE